jgi:Zn-dependent peptidase ImmA (M78 family)
MSDELRMDLADCGSPEGLITAILKHHPNWTVPVPVEELAREVGIIDLVDLEVDGFEGALKTDIEKTQGIILIKTGVREDRRRFTIAHELGHFLMPSHRGNGQCTSKDLHESGQGGEHRRQEAEANRFAAGLLMPSSWFTRDMSRLGEADVTHVQLLAKKYGTSLEAAVNRYVDLSDDVCAFVFSKDGVIRYVRRTDNFPRLILRKGDPLPDRCASVKAPLAPLRVATSWEEVDESIWLASTWGERTPTLLKQSVRQKEGFQITLLFIDSTEAEQNEEDAELEEDFALRFWRK